MCHERWALNVGIKWKVFLHLLILNRKSHMSFRLVPNSVTLDDLERRNSFKPQRNFIKFGSFRNGLRKS